MRVFGEASQRDTMAFVMRMPMRSDLGKTGRLTRMYIYNFQNPCCPRQDRGLIAPATITGNYDRPSRVRGAFLKVCNKSGAPGPKPATCPPPAMTSSQPPSAPPAATPPPAPAPPPAAPPPPASAVPRDICVAHPSDPSVVCTRNNGRIVDACDRDADGHRAYARIITDATKPNFASPFYDTNDSQPGCGNYSQSSLVRSVAVCVQYEGCSAFKPT